MIYFLFAFVLSWMNTLAPGKDHSELAWAVACVADSKEEAALITAVAFRESTLKNDAIGDNGKSVCAMQIYDGSKSLLADPVACVRRGTIMLRESRRIDFRNPVAFYVRGPNYLSEEAKRLSRNRVALAKRLLQQKVESQDWTN